jgi:CIC family chloride channel protein
VMTPKVETLAADLPLADALTAIEDGAHHAYPVVDGAGRPVGLVSRSDALDWALEERDGDVAEGTLGERVSDADLAVVHPGDVVSHALDVMLAAGQGRLPVTDPQSGRLVGLLTRKDLLQVRATVVRAEAERRAFFRSRDTRRTQVGT